MTALAALRRAGRVAAVLLLVLAPQAQALSCLRPDPLAAFNRFAEADESYIVAHGSFQFEESALPGLQGKAKSVPARFTGTGLTREGFTVPMTRDVTLDITCAGSWCGGIIAGRDMLVFLERRADGLHLALPACPFAAFDLPDAATLDGIAACFRNGRC